MRTEAISLEEERLKDVSNVEDYPAYHERHRVFPALFEDRNHRRIFDSSAGIGVVAKQIVDHYDAKLICNEISPKCLSSLGELGVKTSSFDLDHETNPFPFDDGAFDAIISLATIEHLTNVDHFMNEIHRILDDNGCFYLSTPNYAGLLYSVPFFLSGKTFHDPLGVESRYEFYAHVKYFTYDTLLDFVRSFGFHAEAVYLPVPKTSSRFLALQERSKFKALLFKTGMEVIYRFFSPRWASEPIICFRKGNDDKRRKPRKVIL